MKCKVIGCYAVPMTRGLCRGHYHEWQQQLPTITERSRPERGPFRNSAPATCRCTNPVPGVIQLFGWGSQTYHEREPRPGDAVQCRNCGMPMAEYLERSPHEAV